MQVGEKLMTRWALSGKENIINRQVHPLKGLEGELTANNVKEGMIVKLLQFGMSVHINVSAGMAKGPDCCQSPCTPLMDSLAWSQFGITWVRHGNRSAAGKRQIQRRWTTQPCELTLRVMLAFTYVYAKGYLALWC